MALPREDYLHCGIISALSVLQGSHGPVMFAALIVDYIVCGQTTLEELEAISDPERFKQEASYN